MNAIEANTHLLSGDDHDTHTHLLTYGQTELQDVNGSLLFQKTHEAKQQVLLISDLLQIQLQHLIEKQSLARHSTSQTRSKKSIVQSWWPCDLVLQVYVTHNISSLAQSDKQISKQLCVKRQVFFCDSIFIKLVSVARTEVFLLRVSANFCRNDTCAVRGSVNGSG